MSAHSAKQIIRRAKQVPRAKESSRKINRRIEAKLSKIETHYIPRKWGTKKPR